MATDAEIQAWLLANAPDVAAVAKVNPIASLAVTALLAPHFDRLSKDMTVGDVHAPTALGEDDKRRMLRRRRPKRARKFESYAEMVEEMQESRKRNSWVEDQVEGETYGKSVVFDDEGADDHLWTADWEIKKVDEDKQQIFGWASVSMVDGELIVDKQDDVIPIEELEKAAYDFTLYHRVQGDMHSTLGMGRLIESCLFNAEKEACGIFAKNEQGQTIAGWWVGFQVDDNFWKLYKEGKRAEFSIGGRAFCED